MIHWAWCEVSKPELAVTFSWKGFHWRPFYFRYRPKPHRLKLNNGLSAFVCDGPSYWVEELE